MGQQRSKLEPVVVRPRPKENKRGGISAVSILPDPSFFITGGHDHYVHLWTINHDDISRSIPQLIDIKHTSSVQTLLPLYDTSQKLVSAGADCTMNLWDFSSEKTVYTMKASNSIFHVHHVPISDSCVLLEVSEYTVLKT